MKTTILGIPCDDSGGSLIADDGSIIVFGTNEKEQSFHFSNAHLENFSGFFEKYNCVSLGFRTTSASAVLSIDALRFRERLRKLALTLEVPTEVVYSGKGNPFESLRELTFSGFSPKGFPDLHGIASLRKLTVDYDKDSVDQWIDLKQIDDLHILAYGEPDLSSLKDLSSVRRLRLDLGNMKSLTGIECLPQLETLFIGNAKKLVDVGAVLKSSSLKNVMFENYKKIQDWSFLETKRDLRYICLDTAESVGFIRALPDLQFFFCKKVKNRNNKSVLFSTELHQDTMTKDGIQVSYIPAGDQFYQPLESLSATRP